MHNPQTNSHQQQSDQSRDPYGPSYPQSAAQYILYRIGMTLLAVVLVIIGKSNLPDDAVKCIEDVVIDWLKPVTTFYLNNRALGLVLMTIMQLIVDGQMIGMAILWYLFGKSFRYPLAICILGVSKIILNMLFQIRPIDDSFTETVIPSLAFGQSFKNTYFFSGVITFLLFNIFQLRQMGYTKLGWIQAGFVVYCSFLLLTMRQNFFMDIATALVFGHYVFVFVAQRAKNIDNLMLSWIDKYTITKETK